MKSTLLEMSCEKYLRLTLLTLNDFVVNIWKSIPVTAKTLENERGAHRRDIAPSLEEQILIEVAKSQIKTSTTGLVGSVKVWLIFERFFIRPTEQIGSVTFASDYLKKDNVGV